jgi:phage tail-like protein
MPQKSSYLQYLPPVLWEKEPTPPAFSLGAILCVFEKALTGIEDDVPAQHDSVKALIDRLPQLFDPWLAPPDYLPWLASWVGLALPDDWDEYRRRRTVSEMVGVYRQRGSWDGLARLLDIFTAGPLEPRIAIDDGSKLLAARLAPDSPVDPFTLVSQGPLIRNQAPFLEGLVRPQCLAVAPDGSLFVGDAGYLFAGVNVPARLWHLSATGEYPFANGKPQPLQQFHNPDGTTSPWSFKGAIGVAVRNRQTPAWQVWFLDGDFLLYLLTPADNFRAQKFSPANPAPAWPPTFSGLTFTPVAMTADPGTNELVFLDRGAIKTSPASPGVVVLGNLDGGPPDGLPKLHRVALQKVVEPLSLTVLADGDYLVGDGGKQTQQSPPVAADLTGNLVRVHLDRSDNANWVATETVLLDPPSSPLVAPTGLGQAKDGSVVVVDVGLKPLRPNIVNPFLPDVAEPAAVYRLKFQQAGVSLERVSKPGRLVYPAALLVADNMAYIADPGVPPVASQDSTWRVMANSFGVIVHYPSGRLPSSSGERTAAMNKVVGAVRDVLDQESPAQSTWALLTQSSA